MRGRQYSVIQSVLGRPIKEARVTLMEVANGVYQVTTVILTGLWNTFLEGTQRTDR